MVKSSLNQFFYFQTIFHMLKSLKCVFLKCLCWFSDRVSLLFLLSAGSDGSGFIKGDQFVTSHSDCSQETGEKGRNSAAICTSPDWLSKTEDHLSITVWQHRPIIIIMLLVESPCPSVRCPSVFNLKSREPKGLQLEVSSFGRSHRLP